MGVEGHEQLGHTHASPDSVKAFGAEHAKVYDSRAELVMGDRDRHRRSLRDLLHCLPQEPRNFVELGCGTGYFTEVLFEVFPGIRGIGIDGSEAMLEEARSRFRHAAHDLTIRCELLQTMDWSAIGTTSLVFSAFAVHHLSDDEKRNLFRETFAYLEPGGSFILFDAFRPKDSVASAMVDRLACLEIQRRVQDARGSAPPLETILARDREAGEAEGDQEASVDAHLGWLRETGFDGVLPVFLENRFGGIAAVKPA
jgi:tRNA (cmo5U34)-methyltransferase